MGHSHDAPAHALPSRGGTDYSQRQAATDSQHMGARITPSGGHELPTFGARITPSSGHVLPKFGARITPSRGHGLPTFGVRITPSRGHVLPTIGARITPIRGALSSPGAPAVCLSQGETLQGSDDFSQKFRRRPPADFGFLRFGHHGFRTAGDHSLPCGSHTTCIVGYFTS